ncbi:unnamed protein product, partial [Vitis vinifera]
MSTNCLLVFVSRLMNSLGYGNTQKNHGNFMDEVEKCSLYFVYLALAVMVVAFMEGYCWSRTSERQVLRIRYKYLEAVLRQEVGFFDSQEATTSEIINSISKDTSLIQEVLSEKVPTFLMHASVFISGLAFATYFSWRLSLVAFPLLLLLIIPGMVYGKYLLYLSKKCFKEYGKANSIVEQALSSIKTVYSFTAERRIVERYSAILDKTTSLGIKQGIAKGLAVGSTGLSFAIWAFLSWYGSRLVMYKGESGGRIYAAGISFILGGLSLGMALPDVKYFTEASVAATRIFDRIDRIPEIDGEDDKGLVLDKILGELEFEHVNFTYPSRPDSIVLKDFNLKVQAGKTVALVGASGSGKSTAIALLQRFYDADHGVIRIDGVDIRTLQLKWIRGKMGLVSQEHALFGTSIKENIIFGKPNATMDEVVAAAMAANAHNFIRQLPEGYETKVGERGALLSGGQKQRIAIARAIIKNPVILLLDEATSALDSESETLVQNALDQASMGRTTLVVAHKLATVRNADLIAVMNGGCVIEIGSHHDLINKKNGHYAKLAKMQRQFSCDDQEQNSETWISSVARSSLIGSLSAIAFGAVQPVYALTIGGMISAFFLPILLSNISNNVVEAQNQSTQIAVEAVYNHRIVTSFGSVGKVLQLFDEAQEEPRKEAMKKSWLAGIGMGSALCLTFMSWALDFWYGGKLVESGQISAGDVFKTFFVLVSTGKVIADAGSMTSDLAKGSTAVASVFEILDRQSLIPGSYNAGDNMAGTKLEKMSGGIEIKKVDFAYPSRKESLVLRQFCLEVKPGTSIGLVGKSGCGKSTVIGLIQRFYDADKGTVKVDGVDIRELDLGWYRMHMALVSQEPVIYSGSIRDNILFGKLDASENEVVEAARAANAHEFISSLKDGYETECGERGVQLSGGQKQRITIARAIIRNPIVLLLDEATSALDVQSEQVVQEALDRIMVGRTTIVVAHRLNTIKKLDSIAFVSEGKVVERGTYAQLKSKRGAFFNLASLQK